MLFLDNDKVHEERKPIGMLFKIFHEEKGPIPVQISIWKGDMDDWQLQFDV